MSINTRVESGQLFVRFVSVGLISLFVSVIFLKFTSIFGAYTTLILGLCIFIINLVAVLGYTIAVLKSPQILAETDAPDLAYYLGFCLTVGALSATFIVDTMLNQFATINLDDKGVALLQTDLIKSSLVQFGVGLTATLIGLCAKIYLASKQSSESLEPEELYRNFRVEINTFEKEMRLITDSYTRTVEDNISKLNDSVSRFDASITSTFVSFDKLREVVNKSNELITSNISHDNISKPINDFIISISEITKITKEFVSVGNEANERFKDISSSMISMKSNIETTDVSLKSLQASTVWLSNSAQDLVESNNSIKSSNQSLSTDIAGFSSTIKLATQNAGDFLSGLRVAGEKITQTGQEFSELNNKTQLGVAGFTQFSEKLNSLVTSLSQFGNQLTVLENLLTKNNSDLKLSNETSNTFISDVEKFQTVIKNITSDLIMFESKLNRINTSN
jgi:hypothetical protein